MHTHKMTYNFHLIVSSGHTYSVQFFLMPLELMVSSGLAYWFEVTHQLVLDDFQVSQLKKASVQVCDSADSFIRVCDSFQFVKKNPPEKYLSEDHVNIDL